MSSEEKKNYQKLLKKVKFLFNFFLSHPKNEGTAL